MTTKKIQLVKASWRLFRSIDPVVFGDVFYSKLFFDHPQLKSLFRVSKEEQSKKLVDTLNVIMGHLDKLGSISESITALAVRHVQYGVMPQHYRAIGDALLWTLQQGLGTDWTAETKEAWQACYTELSDLMIAATKEIV